MRTLGALAVVFGVAVVSVLAQQPAPEAVSVGLVSVRNGGLLTYVTGGQYLVAADGAQLQLYDVSAPQNPRDVATIALDAEPIALNAGADFALAILPTDDSTDQLIVVAPDLYSRGGFGIVNAVQAPKNPRALALSPDNQWALVSGSDGYITLALAAADSIESSALIPTGDAPVTAAALTDAVALLAREGIPEITVYSLSTNRFAQDQPRILALEAPATALALNADATLGAVALDDHRLSLFRPSDLTLLGTIPLEDGPVRKLRFLNDGERQILALMVENRPAVMLLDVTDPQNVSLPGSAGTNRGSPIRDIATYNGTLVLSDGDSVQLLQSSDVP